MKIFGREPAVWLGMLASAVGLLVVLGVLDWSNEEVALLMGAAAAAFAVLTAYLTKDTMLGVLVGLVEAIAAAYIGFGFELSPDVTAAVIAAVTTLVAFFQRTQTSPAETPSFA